MMRHYYQEIMDRLNVEASITPTDIGETPNQYIPGGLPWYQFTWCGAKVTMGPRKRVISIKVEYPSPYPHSHIQAVAKEHGTTYEGKVAPRPVLISTLPLQYQDYFNKEYPSGYVDLDHIREGEDPTTILIHAWNQDACIEYLILLLKDLPCP